MRKTEGRTKLYFGKNASREGGRGLQDETQVRTRKAEVMSRAKV